MREPTTTAPGIKLGELGVFAPEPEDPDDLCYGLYLQLGPTLVFVDIREDKLIEQRKGQALYLFKHSAELAASLQMFIDANPEYAARRVGYIGLHSKHLDQGEVFWDPEGYTLLKGLSFVLE